MTYSLALTGTPATNPTQPLSRTVDDASARPGSMASVMSLGAPFLCKRPDGSEAYYKYDAERSDPATGKRVLLRV